MQNLVLISPVHLEGKLLCRVPGCSSLAKVHVNRYMRSSAEDNWWDARSSGPFCEIHLSRMQSDWSDCEVRDPQGRMASQTAPQVGCAQV